MYWPDKWTFICAVILYGVSALYSIFLFRKGLRQDNRVTYVLLLFGFIFHTLAMVQRGFALDRCPVRNLYEATLFVEWTMVAFYLAIGLWSRLRFLGAFASPLLFAIGVFALMPELDVLRETGEFHTSGGWISLHGAVFALAYGAFGLSSVAGIMYLRQERDLKLKKARAILSLMPPLQRLELAASRLLIAGFVLLTAGLFISAALTHETRDQLGPLPISSDPKVVWTLLVWALYFGLLILRWRFAQSARRFAWGAIGVFLFVLLTFPLTNLLSPLHQR